MSENFKYLYGWGILSDKEWWTPSPQQKEIQIFIILSFIVIFFYKLSEFIRNIRNTKMHLA